MMRWAAATLAVVLLGGAALASEQSERLYARGLIDFHAEKYQDALALFDQAVAADADDPFALYYRGVTRERLNDYPGATADLRAALRLDPQLTQAAFELGYALVQTGAYADAVPWLQQAQGAPELAAEASLYLGLAQLRLGQNEAARENFQLALQSPALTPTARYYLGIAEYQTGNLPAAEEHFTAVQTASPESEMGREAAAFLERLRSGVTRPDRDFELYGTLGLQYDSNVNLAPNDELAADTLGVSDKSDGRVTLFAGGNYRLINRPETQLALGYEFFQSLHFDLTSFNLQDHRPYLQLTHQAGPVWLGFFTRYDYYLRKSDSFLEQVTALPYVTVPEGDFGRTVVYFRWWWRNFYPGQYQIRDANNYAPGIQQFFYLGKPERYLQLGYRFANETPTRSGSAAESFAYDGNQVAAGVGWTFDWDIAADLLFAYTREDYAAASQGRNDNEYQLACVARKWFTDYVGVSAGYFGTFNDSNKQEFSYDRNIGSVALELRY